MTCVMGCIFTDAFKIHGAVMAYSESLLYAGYQNLNLSQIYMSGIFIGASGAMMDLSVDITSAVNEVICKKPNIGWKEAARSGMNVGRAAMGTMTTIIASCLFWRLYCSFDDGLWRREHQLIIL